MATLVSIDCTADAQFHDIRRRTHYAQSQVAQREMPVEGWRRARLAEGKSARQSSECGKGLGNKRSRSSCHAVSRRADGNCVARESLRSVAVDGEPERVEPAAWLSLVQQPYRRREEEAGRNQRSTAR